LSAGLELCYIAFFGKKPL